MSGHDNIVIAPPLESLLDPDPVAWLVWAPLAETGEPMPCDACEDICTCGEEIDDEEE